MQDFILFECYNLKHVEKSIIAFKIIIISIFIVLYCNSYNLLSLYEKYKNIKDFKNIENYFNICNNKILINNNKKFTRNRNPKVSVIIPNYNRGKYLLRLLRSLQNQFFDDIEIIIVDDFSKDNTINLIKEYQKEDERIILIKHHNNKGTLISRNIGIAKSKGEYIMLPDSDDILSENILKTCYEVAIKNKIEMIRFNIYLGNGNIFFDYFVNKLKVKIIFQPELKTYLFYGLGTLEQLDFNLSNKFIKRDAYIRALNSINKFYLNQYMINYEDGLMNYMLYRTAKSFIFIKKIGYYYLLNNQSISLKPKKNYEENFKFIFLQLKFIIENTKNTQYEKDIANSALTKLSSLFKENFIITKDFKFYKEVIDLFLKCKFINDENKSILKNLYF
jgi:glycosyltransferase involved in cell wall biosynthesis